MEQENNTTDQEKTNSSPVDLRAQRREARRIRRANRREGFNLGRVLLGVFLVFIGIIYFLKTTGIVDIQINLDVWRLWPMLIIFAGLSMINFRGWPGLLAGALITIVLIVGMIFITFFNISFFSKQGLDKPINREISIEKSSRAASANINIKFGAGNIDIKDSSSDKLVSGTFESSFSDLNISEQIGAGTQKVLFENKAQWRGFGNVLNDLSLEINRDIPINLLVDSGASNSKIDLSNIIIESVEINTGASASELTLGDKQKESNVKINAGASSIIINLPKTVGVKMNIASGFASKRFDGFKQVDKQNWETENYEKSDKKINIEISMGVSDLKINWK